MRHRRKFKGRKSNFKRRGRRIKSYRSSRGGVRL